MNYETDEFRNSPEVTLTRNPGRPRDIEVRQRILASAAYLLEGKGLAEITTEAIAEHSGASKATIYRWWPNKAAVLIDAFREAVARELPFPDTGSLSEDVRSQLRQFAAMLREGRGRAFAAFIAGAQTDPDMAAAFRDFWIRPRRSEFIHALEMRKARGELRTDVDLEIVVDLLYAPLYYRLLTGWGPLSDEYTDAITAAALKGLMPG